MRVNRQFSTQTNGQREKSPSPDSNQRSRGSYQMNSGPGQPGMLQNGLMNRYQQNGLPLQQPYQSQQEQMSPQTQQTSYQNQNQPQYQTQAEGTQSPQMQQQRQSQFKPQLKSNDTQSSQEKYLSPSNKGQSSQFQNQFKQQQQQEEDQQSYRRGEMARQEEFHPSAQMQDYASQRSTQDQQYPQNQFPNSKQGQQRQQSYPQNQNNWFPQQHHEEDDDDDYNSMQQPSVQQQMQETANPRSGGQNRQNFPQQLKLRTDSSNSFGNSQQHTPGQSRGHQPLIQQSLENRQSSMQTANSPLRNSQFQDNNSQYNNSSPPKNFQNPQNQYNFNLHDIGPLEDDSPYDAQVVPGSILPKVQPDSAQHKDDPFFQKKGFCVDFKQQNIKGYYFMPSSMCVIICNSCLGLLLLILGGIILAISNSVIEVDTNYTKCTLNNLCTFEVNVSSTMKSPVYVYIKLTNYYQNHRRYAIKPF